MRPNAEVRISAVHVRALRLLRGHLSNGSSLSAGDGERERGGGVLKDILYAAVMRMSYTANLNMIIVHLYSLACMFLLREDVSQIILGHD